MLLVIGLGAAVSTALGGLFALRYQDRLHLILGLSAGAVMAVALLDLLAEAVDLAAGRHDTLSVMGVAVIGSVLYMCLDRALPRVAAPGQAARGHLGAGSLTLHSFLDGFAVGLAFKVSSRVGIPVAAAVLAHDFSDGINTVNISLAGGVQRSGARRWLVADAVAPLLGIGAAATIAIDRGRLGLTLALFSGFFLYIGWSELSPESYHRHPRIWTTVSTILGAAAMYLVIRLAG